MTARWGALLVLAVVLGSAVMLRDGGQEPPRLQDARVSGGAVVLSFSERPVAALSHVSVTGGTGTPAVASGDALVVPLTGASDPHVVTYHAVFADGRELAGEAAPGRSAPASAAGHEHGADPVGAVLLLIDALAVTVVAVLLLRRPRRPV